MDADGAAAAARAPAADAAAAVAAAAVAAAAHAAAAVAAAAEPAAVATAVAAAHAAAAQPTATVATAAVAPTDAAGRALRLLQRPVRLADDVYGPLGHAAADARRSKSKLHGRFELHGRCARGREQQPLGDWALAQH